MSTEQPARPPERLAAAPATIPFVTLTNWVRASAQLGVPIEALFREVGIDTDVVNPQTATVRPEALWRLMPLCVAEAQARAHHDGVPVRHFPFVLGESFAFASLSDVETFLTTSPTLRTSLRVFDWVRVLVTPQVDIELVEEGDVAELVVHLEPVSALHRPADFEHYFIETFFAAVLKFARMLLGASPPFTRLEFAYPAPPYAALYEPFYGMPVQFGQPRTQAVFARHLLDQPLRGAFPTLNTQAEQRVERRLAQMPKTGELVQAMEQAWLDHPLLLAESIESMAAHLRMHERSLQRRLRELGLSYRELQGQYKFRTACQWLEKGERSIKSISEALGYTDRRSFTEAFKKWSGRSPTAYRKAAGNP